MYHYRPVESRDIQHLMDIDLKAYERPWSFDTWTEDGLYIYVALSHEQRVPIAFIAYMRDKPSNSIQIIKLAVKPRYRRKRIGTTLVKRIAQFAWESKVPKLVAVIPAHKCLPGPDNVSQFLARNKFRATSVIEDAAKYCGEPEDAYIFEHDIRGI